MPLYCWRHLAPGESNPNDHSLVAPSSGDGYSPKVSRQKPSSFRAFLPHWTNDSKRLDRVLCTYPHCVTALFGEKYIKEYQFLQDRMKGNRRVFFLSKTSRWFSLSLAYLRAGREGVISRGALDLAFSFSQNNFKESLFVVDAEIRPHTSQRGVGLPRTPPPQRNCSWRLALGSSQQGATPLGQVPES